MVRLRGLSAELLEVYCEGIKAGLLGQLVLVENNVAAQPRQLIA